jgi:O-antigen/teichoic acid export membrane protein
MEPFEQQELDPAIEISLEAVKKKAIRGVAILTGRGFLLNGLSQLSWFLLYLFLDPAEIGVFIIVSAAVSFLIYFSDIGLAAALIQKKDEPTELDLKTTFTVQQILVLVLLIILFILSPYIRNIYHLSDKGVYLLYALGFGLFLSSLKSVPSVLLERRLEFGKFVLPEILENLFYNITVVILAWQGYGVLSFAYGVIVRGFVGVVTIYILQPWMPGFAFSKKAIKGLLRFGVPYQANSLISVIKDQGITLFLGGILSQAAIGYLGTAMKLSQLPLRLFMDNVTKVSFPAFARMQDVKQQLADSVTRSVMFITFMVFPILLGTAAIMSDLIVVIPKYGKWEPALLPLYLVSVNAFFAAMATQLSNMLTAIGKIKLTIYLTIMYSALTIIFVPVFALKYGVDGAAVGYLIVGLSSIVAIYVAKRIVDFSIMKSMVKPATASLAMLAVVLVLKSVMGTSLINLLVMIGMGGVTYIGVSYLLLGNELVSDIKKLSKSFLNK